MKSIPHFFPLAPFALAAAALLSTSCGTVNPNGKDGRSRAGNAPAGNGVVWGQATLIGGRPTHPIMTKQGRRPLSLNGFEVDDDHRLGNVFVYISRGLEGRVFEPPADPVIVECRGVGFHAPVAGARPDQKVIWKTVGKATQTIVSHPVSPGNPAFKHDLLSNVTIETRYPAPELFLRHATGPAPEQNAYLCVVEHPYFAVTDKHGRFALPGVLPRGRYTLTARHALAGEVSTEVILSGGDNARMEVVLAVPGSGQASRVAAVESVPASAKVRAASSRKLEPAPVRRPSEASRYRLQAKLKSMVFEEVLYDDLPLGEVVRYLDSETRKKDPNGKGVHFLFAHSRVKPQVTGQDAIGRPGPPGASRPGATQRKRTPPLLDAFGQPIGRGLPPSGSIDLENTIITIDPPIRDVRLADLLDAIVKSANAPIEYLIEDYAIVFQSKQGESVKRSSRLAAVPPDTPKRDIVDKLDSIQFPEVLFDDLPLGEALKFMGREARKLDPDGKGVNILIEENPKTASRSKPGPWPVDLKNVIISLDPPLRDLTLAQALDAIVRTADEPIEFRIENYGVVFYSRAQPVESNETTLFTRVFKVDSERLLKGLRDSYSGDSANASIQSLFSSALGNGAPGGVEPNVVLNADGGALLVRATEGDLERIQALVEVLDLAPAQVSLDVRIMEVAVKDFDRYIESHPIYSQTLNTENFNGILTEAEFRDMLKRLSGMKGARLVYAPSVTTLSGHLAEFQFDPETTLSIEPTVGPDGKNVRMNVVFVLFSQGKANEDEAKPNQSLKTTTGVQNRQTIMLGGLIKSDGQGRSRLSSRDKNVIMLLITPTVVNAPGESSSEK
jgi:hypothetical protein